MNTHDRVKLLSDIECHIWSLESFELGAFLWPAQYVMNIVLNVLICYV